MKKKILILHNRNSLNYYKKNYFKKFDKIIIIDHLTAIDCYNSNLKFKYKNKLLKSNNNLSFFLKKIHKYLYKIDLNLRKNQKLKNKFYFSNYFMLNRDFSLIMYFKNLTDKIINSILKNDIYYFNIKDNERFDFFIEIISSYKLKNLIPIDIKNIKYKNSDNELLSFFRKNDESNIHLSKIKKFIFNFLKN